MRALTTLLCAILLTLAPAVVTAQDAPEEPAELPELPTAPYVREDADALAAHAAATEDELERVRESLREAEAAAAEQGLTDEQRAERDAAVETLRGEVATTTESLQELREAVAEAETGPTREQLNARRSYDEAYELVVQIRRDLKVRTEGNGADAISEGDYARRIREAEEEQYRIEKLAADSGDFEIGKSRVYDRLSDLEKVDYERRWAEERLQLSINAYDHLDNVVLGAYREYERRAARGVRAVSRLRELWGQIQGTPAQSLEIPEAAREISELNLSVPGQKIEIRRRYEQRIPAKFTNVPSGSLDIAVWENRLRDTQQEIDVREDFLERLEEDAERLKGILSQGEAAPNGETEAGNDNGVELQEYQKLGEAIDEYDQDLVRNRNEIEDLEEERVGLTETHRQKQEVEGQVEAQVRETEALIRAMKWHFLPDSERPEDEDAPTLPEDVRSKVESFPFQPEIWIFHLEERLQAVQERLGSARRDTRQAATQIDIVDRRIERLRNRNAEIENDLLPNTRDQYYKEIARTVGVRAGKVIIVLFSAWLLLLVIRKFGEPMVERVINRSGKKKTFNADEQQRARTIMTVFMTTAKVVVYLTAIMFAIAQFDVDYGPLLVAAGGVSLAVGFGAQTLVKDFFAGFFILLEGQYSIGDWVEVGGKGGTVEHIGLRTTVLRSLTGDVHTIPNGEITSTTNMTKVWSRAVIDVGVAYEENVDEIGEVIQTVAKEMREDKVWGEKVLDVIYMGVQSLDDSSVALRMLLKTRAGEQWGASREFKRRYKLKFDELGIEIPWPQRVISHKEYAGMSDEDIQKVARAKRAKMLRYTRKLRGEETPEDAALAAMSVEERDRAETLAKHETEIARVEATESKDSKEEPKSPEEVAEEREEADEEEEQLSAAEKWAKQKATETLSKEELDERRKKADKEAGDPGNDKAGGDDEEKK